MKPSDVILHAVPLIGCFGHTEAEVAAAMLIQCCVELGDTWQPIAFDTFFEHAKKGIEEKRAPWAAWGDNPFLAPGPRLLVQRGYAVEEPTETFALTPAGLARLDRYVRRG